MVFLNEQSPRSDDPPESLIPLKNHQKAILYKIGEVEKTESAVIFSDHPGSGKSYVILAKILWDTVHNNDKTNLLVIPMNIYRQWMNYIETYTKGLKIKSFIDYNSIMSISYHDLKKYDLLITTPLYYSRICDSINHIDRIIFDELDSVEFFMNKKINYDFIWYISASFDESKLGKTLNVITLITNANIIKCEDSFIESSFDIPPLLEELLICYDEYINVFYGISNINSGKVAALDYTDLLQNIKHKASNTKELLSLLMKDTVITIAKINELIEINTKNGQSNETNYAKLLKSENILKTVYERINEKECPICLTEYDSKLKRMCLPCCKNCFCSECVGGIINNNYYKQTSIKCPYCRNSNNLNDVVVVVEEKDEEEDEEVEEVKKVIIKNPEKLPSKMKCLKDLLLKLTGTLQNDKKIIIFSQHTDIFQRVVTLLNHNDINCLRMDEGYNITKLNKILDNFRYGNYKVLLMDTSMYAAGLNLEFTTDVVFLHKTDNMKQVIGRAQRPGRTSPLNVYKIYYEIE